MRDMWGNMASHVARCSCLRIVSIFSETLIPRPLASWKRTNLAFFRHDSTSEGKDDETCGWVAVAEASQFRGEYCVSVMVMSDWRFAFCVLMCDILIR